LSEVLLGQAALVDVVQRTASGVLVVSAGEQPPDPAELLATERPVAVVAELARRADVVLVDCPPVLPVTDALLLTRVADATVVVADARTTERKALAESLELLRQVGAPVAGLVLNSVGVDDPQTERGARRPSARRPTDPTDDIRPSVAAS
jgi:Mrp family chromosome partitioning ATPase